MLKRFPGLLLIGLGVAMVVAGCGDSGGSDDGAVVGPTAGFAARYPTATIEIPATKEAADGFTGVVAFNAQRARGWPTAVGWPGPTARPTPAAVDKSNWTIIKPGECDASTTITVGDLDGLKRKIFRFISRTWADDQAVVADAAALIIHGGPVGDIEMEPADRSGFSDRFYQDVRILSVLSGQAPGDTVRVVQTASDNTISREYLERYKLALGTGENFVYPGPLGQCPQILFLNESSADTYLSIGLAQGYFSLGADGLVTYAPGAESFYGSYGE